MTQRADVEQSAAYGVLGASSRRLLTFIEDEIAREGGGNAKIYTDQLEAVCSLKTALPALSELNALGLLRVARYQKRHLISLSDGWRVVSKRDAMITSARARIHRMPVLVQQQPAPASINAPA